MMINEGCGRKDDTSQQGDSLLVMRSGEETSKAIIAFRKLSGRDGVEVDSKGAVAMLEECVKKGDGEAAWMLGLCCEYGIGIEQDIERAGLLYQQSCETGNAVGMFLLWNGRGGRGNGVIKQKWSL